MMQKWEYKFIMEASFSDGEQKAWVNELGSEGWELVAVCNDGTQTIKYFKRPLEEEQEILWP